METIIITSLDQLEAYKDQETRVIRFEGNVEFRCAANVQDWSIEAGESIEAGWYVFSFRFSVSAKVISTKRLPFWREFWAEMPPLAKYRDVILNESNCWADLKRIGQEDADEICAWEGWHWLLRGQLECLFGLRESFEPPKK